MCLRNAELSSYQVRRIEVKPVSPRYQNNLVYHSIPSLNSCSRAPDMVKIILTGYASLDGGMKALSLGVAAYLVKPVKPQELLSVLESKLVAQKTLTK
jgi:ActR/RegA family two-component response regulator